MKRGPELAASTACRFGTGGSAPEAWRGAERCARGRGRGPRACVRRGRGSLGRRRRTAAPSARRCAEPGTAVGRAPPAQREGPGPSCGSRGSAARRRPARGPRTRAACGLQAGGRPVSLRPRGRQSASASERRCCSPRPPGLALELGAERGALPLRIESALASHFEKRKWNTASAAFELDVRKSVGSQVTPTFNAVPAESNPAKATCSQAQAYRCVIARVSRPFVAPGSAKGSHQGRQASRTAQPRLPSAAARHRRASSRKPPR